MKTIKSSAEISELFHHGRRISAPDFNLIILQRSEQHDRDGRVAFIAGKKLGNAVWRNRAKRRMRALCFQAGGPFEGFDVAFVAKKSISEAPFEIMVARLSKALDRAGLAQGSYESDG